MALPVSSMGGETGEIIELVSSDEDTGPRDSSPRAASGAPGGSGSNVSSAVSSARKGLFAHFRAEPKAPRQAIQCPVCQRNFKSEKEVRQHVEWCLQHQQVSSFPISFCVIRAPNTLKEVCQQRHDQDVAASAGQDTDGKGDFDRVKKQTRGRGSDHSGGDHRVRPL